MGQQSQITKKHVTFRRFSGNISTQKSVNISHFDGLTDRPYIYSRYFSAQKSVEKYNTYGLPRQSKFFVGLKRHNLHIFRHFLPSIFRLFRLISPSQYRTTLIGVPILLSSHQYSTSFDEVLRCFMPFYFPSKIIQTLLSVTIFRLFFLIFFSKNSI